MQRENFVATRRDLSADAITRKRFGEGERGVGNKLGLRIDSEYTTQALNETVQSTTGATAHTKIFGKFLRKAL